MDPTLGNKWHGQVMFLKVYDGNTAVIGGIETGQYGFIGTYDVWIVVDNGEGANATPDVLSTCIYWAHTLEDAERVWNLPPEQIITEMANLWGWNEDEIMIPIEMGNIQVRLKYKIKTRIDMFGLCNVEQTRCDPRCIEAAVTAEVNEKRFCLGPCGSAGRFQGSLF